MMDKENRKWECWDDKRVKSLEGVWSKGPGGFHKKADHIIENEKAPWPHRDKILDAGCGTGCFYKYLSEKFGDYTGIDSSPAMINRAKELSPEGKFQLDDLYNLSFKDNTFDYVFCHAILVHLPEIATPIKEMYRVAKGRVFFNCWTAPKDVLHEVKNDDGTCTYYHGVDEEHFKDILNSLSPCPADTYEFHKSTKPIALAPGKQVFGRNFFIDKQ